MRSGSLLHVATLAARLEDLLGPDRVSMRTQAAIQGVRPRAEVRPADVGQLASVLAMANEEALGVCVAGAGSKLGWGNPPARFDMLVTTGSLPEYCHVDADDLTMTVSASTVAAAARAAARERGRILPLDPQSPASATIGGVVAAADQGPRSAGYGGIRDVVLGLRAVLADGRQVKFGGLTVKNVAGYDMTKLFVGSHGVLGVLTEINLRLLPRPDSEALLLLPVRSLAQAREAATGILDAGLQPFALEVLSAAALARSGEGLTGPAGTLAEPGWLVAGSGLDGEPGWLLLLAGFWGHKAAVDRSVHQARQLWSVGDGLVLRDSEAEVALDALTEAAPPADGVAGRASVPIGTVWELAERADRLAAERGIAAAYRIGAARGTLAVVSERDVVPTASPGISPDPAAPDPAAPGSTAPGSATPGAAAAAAHAVSEWLQGVRTEAVRLGGHLMITTGSEVLDPRLDAWGDPGPAVEVMRGLKERFDPRGTLNAGRFVGGI